MKRPKLGASKVDRDITERKSAERALHESAGRMRALIETAVDGAILIDARGVVLMFNPACERLFGYFADEVIGKNVKMLMPEPYSMNMTATSPTISTAANPRSSASAAKSIAVIAAIRLTGLMEFRGAVKPHCGLMLAA
jgi:PAS domain-containing protein